jgi:hypothetical protein
LLYATTEKNQNKKHTTIVVAASSQSEFNKWFNEVKKEGGSNYESAHSPSLLDKMKNPTYKQFKHKIMVFEHSSMIDQMTFIKENKIEVLKSMPAIDKQDDMVHEQREQFKEENLSEHERSMTIGEVTGLSIIDPWDRRSEAELEKDKILKETLDKLEAAGELTAQSFKDHKPSTNNDVPGAYERSRAIDALKTFESYKSEKESQELDFDTISNAELAKMLTRAGVPNVVGVYDDGKVPQRTEAEDRGAKLISGEVKRTTTGELEITDVQAAKWGGEVDHTLLESRKASKENKDKPKVKLSPDDFRKAFQGAGQSHLTGNKATTPEPTERPQYSPEVEAEIQRREQENLEVAKKKAAEVKADIEKHEKQEQENNIFRGVELDGDPVQYEDFTEEVQRAIDPHKTPATEYVARDYPYNAMLAGRAILPSDNKAWEDNGVFLLDLVDLKNEGVIGVAGPRAYIVSTKGKDGYAIYKCRNNRILVLKIRLN